MPVKTLNHAGAVLRHAGSAIASVPGQLSGVPGYPPPCSLIRPARVFTKPQPREHRTHTPSNRIRPCGELMLPGLFGSTTIDCFACMEKANTRETADATGVGISPELMLKHMRFYNFSGRSRIELEKGDGADRAIIRGHASTPSRLGRSNMVSRSNGANWWSIGRPRVSISPGCSTSPRPSREPT